MNEVRFMNETLNAKDYKCIALDALRGNWKTAMLTGFVASLFGAGTIYSGSGNYSSDDSEIGQQILEFFRSPEGKEILGIALSILGALAILAIVSIFISGAMRLGYAKFNLNLIDRKPVAFSDLFSQMDRKWKGFCMNFLTGLYIFLWTLLLVIPGIVKSFSYAMTPFILSENPHMTANEAITESRELMDGNKWRLFCLYLSFIGWSILTSLPGMAAIAYSVFRFNSGNIKDALCGFIAAFILMILGYIPLMPYMEAANAAFYRSIVPAKSEETEWYLSD